MKAPTFWGFSSYVIPPELKINFRDHHCTNFDRLNVKLCPESRLQSRPSGLRSQDSQNRKMTLFTFEETAGRYESAVVSNAVGPQE